MTCSKGSENYFEQVSRRFELVRVQVIGSQLYNLHLIKFEVGSTFSLPKVTNVELLSISFSHSLIQLKSLC